MLHKRTVCLQLRWVIYSTPTQTICRTKQAASENARFNSLPGGQLNWLTFVFSRQQTQRDNLDQPADQSSYKERIHETPSHQAQPGENYGGRVEHGLNSSERVRHARQDITRRYPGA